MKDYTIVIQQRKNFGESENHSRTIKTNFDLNKNKKLENEIKKIEGIEFCFFESRYTFRISWNILFNDKKILNEVIKTIRNFNIKD